MREDEYRQALAAKRGNLEVHFRKRLRGINFFGNKKEAIDCLIHNITFIVREQITSDAYNSYSCEILIEFAKKTAWKQSSFFKESQNAKTIDFDEELAIADSSQDPYEQLAEKELQEEKLDDLDEKDATLVKYINEGYTYQEVPSLMGISSNALYARTSRLRKKIGGNSGQSTQF